MVRTHFFDVDTIEDLPRTDRVVQLAKELTRAEIDQVDGETLEIVEITALLHDIRNWTWSTRGAPHPNGIELAKRWLTQLEYPEPLTQAVIGALESNGDGGMVEGVIHDAVVMEALSLRSLEELGEFKDGYDLMECWQTSSAREMARRSQVYDQDQDTRDQEEAREYESLSPSSSESSSCSDDE
jgi:hypothetical protein